jgi:hypothetical protein
MRSLILSLGLWSWAGGLWAVPSASPLPVASPLTAKITLKGNAPGQYVLVGCNATTLTLQGGGGSQIGMPIESVQSLLIVPPAEYVQAQEAIGAGDYAKAETLLAPLVPKLMPYLNVTGSNAASMIFVYGEALRLAGRVPAAADLYKQVVKESRPPITQQASLGYAGALASLGKNEEADALLKTLAPLARTDPLFPMDKMARGRVFLIQKKYRQSLDQVAQLIAYYRLDEPWYPEAQFLMAEAYASLAAEMKEKKEPGADKFDKASQAIYSDLLGFFPSSPWAKASEKKLYVKQTAAAAAPAEAKKSVESSSSALGTTSTEKKVQDILIDGEKAKNPPPPTQPQDEMK